jgi:hypothetical protein
VRRLDSDAVAKLSEDIDLIVNCGRQEIVHIGEEIAKLLEDADLIHTTLEKERLVLIF